MNAKENKVNKIKSETSLISVILAEVVYSVKGLFRLFAKSNEVVVEEALVADIGAKASQPIFVLVQFLRVSYLARNVINRDRDSIDL